MLRAIAALAAALVIGATAALTTGALAQADPTPLPPKRPPAAAQAAPAPPPIKPPPAVGGAPVAADVAALGSQAVTSSMTPEQRAVIGKIDDYLNSVRVMSGNFVQVGPDGARTQGQFWVSKPGRLRFQYAPPSPVELVADGRSVAVRDRKLNTQDLYFINQTPLRFLLADRLDLIQDTKVVALYGDKESITVTLEEGGAVGGSARIALRFSSSTYALKQWTITDAQGYDTTVAISDVDTKSTPAAKLFYIEEHRAL